MGKTNRSKSKKQEDAEENLTFVKSEITAPSHKASTSVSEERDHIDEHDLPLLLLNDNELSGAESEESNPYKDPYIVCESDEEHIVKRRYDSHNAATCLEEKDETSKKKKDIKRIQQTTRLSKKRAVKKILMQNQNETTSSSKEKPTKPSKASAQTSLTTKDKVLQALELLDERNGVSLITLKKYLIVNDDYGRDWSKMKTHVRTALTRALQDGWVVRPKASIHCIGLSGKFKINKRMVNQRKEISKAGTSEVRGTAIPAKKSASKKTVSPNTKLPLTAVRTKETKISAKEDKNKNKTKGINAKPKATANVSKNDLKLAITGEDGGKKALRRVPLRRSSSDTQLPFKATNKQAKQLKKAVSSDELRRGRKKKN